MNNLNIKLELNINGAVLVPTNPQFSRIKRAIAEIVFGDDAGSGSTSVAKFKTKRTAVRWGQEELAMGLRQLTGGQKFNDIAQQLNRQFGNNRTKASVQNMLTKTVRDNKAGGGHILDKFSATPQPQARDIDQF